MPKPYEDVLMLAVERPFLFIDYEPRDTPGFQSNIASLFKYSENQTAKLLAAVDTLAEDPHFKVEREVVEQATEGSKGKEYPKKILVTVSAA